MIDNSLDLINANTHKSPRMTINKIIHDPFMDISDHSCIYIKKIAVFFP